ncbi:hypothetical protein TYRP_022044 [Tyrophagus putrescentiae]|nr:hypothetical protein TYRP_022044 [Tyrophagus putrescentiae]
MTELTSTSVAKTEHSSVLRQKENVLLTGTDGDDALLGEKGPQGPGGHVKEVGLAVRSRSRVRRKVACEAHSMLTMYLGTSEQTTMSFRFSGSGLPDGLEEGAPADESVDDLVLAVEHQVGEWLEEDVVFAALLAELQEGVKAAVVEHFEVVMRWG